MLASITTPLIALLAGGVAAFSIAVVGVSAATSVDEDHKGPNHPERTAYGEVAD